MIKKTDIQKIFPMDFKSKNSLFFYIPYLLLILWIFFSTISIFSSFISSSIVEHKYQIALKQEINNNTNNNMSNPYQSATNKKLESQIFNPFTLVSLIIRLSIIALGCYFFYNIFIKRKKEKKFFNIFKAFVGYGAVFTYVFYSLPRMVAEYHTIDVPNANIYLYLVLSFIFTLFISAFPAALYIFLRTDKTRLILEVFSEEEIAYEKKIKKDKALKKKEQKALREKRSFLANLWYEWIDVIVQAIIIALIIQQFLFQMYQIPSESMVNTFKIGDRVVVNKLIYGPHIPLTDWKLPSPIKPKVGDIIVFQNPEKDIVDSDIRFKNVFVRVFQPFIYLLTLSIVDIDKKFDPYSHKMVPKERFIVKRCIARENEKLCVLNDVVYKKRKGDGQWKKMSEIKGQKEYAQVNLYKENTSGLRDERINKKTRDALNNSESFFKKFTTEEIQNMLYDAKENFLAQIKRSNINKSIILCNNIEDSIDLSYLYSGDFDSFSEENDKKYHLFLLFKKIKELGHYLSKYQEDSSFFEKEIVDSLNIDPDASPYTIYMKRLNGLYKAFSLQLYTDILSAFSNNTIYSYFSSYMEIDKLPIYKELHSYYYIAIYTQGGPGFKFNYFSFRNYPDYPKGADTFIGKNQYFLMGDNRYNSQDSRFSLSSKIILKEIALDDDDKGEISLKIDNIDWDGHTIALKYILGKAFLTFWPLDRIKLL